jgi:hypothetical protein
MSEPGEREPAQAARRFGWSSLLVWAALGLALEAAHGFKWSRYLDDPLARLMLTLAHAHGVLLSCVCLVYAVAGVELFGTDRRAARSTGSLLMAAAVLMPCGFGLAALGHGEADPGPAIWLVPVGGACLMVGLGRLAWRSWR